MATNDKTVKVTLVAVATPYAKGMNEASQATRKLGGDIDTVGTKSKGLEATAGKASGALKGLAVAGAAVAGTALVAFLGDAVTAAGDLEQSVGGVNAVFGESAGKIHEFGKNSADAVGLSTNAFNELVTVTGAMLKNKGLSDFAEKSLDLVKIGADLSATFGGSAKDAVEALNAAMRGESDPIERYGISLNETAVNAELAAKGMDKLEGAALDQAKAQARIDIIMRQSTDAMGAFAREADTMQGQQQRLNAEWENAKASLGQALLPAVTSVVEALRVGVDVVVAAVDAWGKLPDPIKAAALALIALKVANGPLTAGLASMSGVVKSFGEAIGFAAQSAQRAGGGFKGLSAGFKTFTGSAGAASMAMGGMKAAGGALMGLAGGPWGLAITGLTLAITGYMQAQENARAAAEEFAGTLDKVTGKFTEQSRELALNKFFKDFAQTDYSQVSASLERAGASVADLIAAYSKGPEAVQAFKEKFDEWRRSQEALDLQRQGVNVEALGNSYAALGRDMEAGAEIAKINADAQDKVAKATGETGDEAAGAAPKVENFAGAVKKVGEEAKTAAEWAKELAEQILAANDAAMSADEAEIAYQKALSGANDRIKRRAELEKELNNATDPKERARIREELALYSKTLDISTAAGQANKQSLIDLAQQARDTAKANLENGDSVDSVRKKMLTARDQFIEVAIKMGASRTEAKALADEYGLTEGSVEALNKELDAVPEKVTSTITAKIVGIEALARFKTMYDSLGNKQVTLSTVFTTQGHDAAQAYRNRFATGGKVSGPGTKTSDSIPALLSDGEYVIKAAAVDKYGPHFFDRLNAMRFADGGHVTRGTATSAAIDYDRLAAAVSGGGSGLVVQIPGADPLATARHALDEFEWRAVNG